MAEKKAIAKKLSGIEIRKAHKNDAAKIKELSRVCYPKMQPYSTDIVRAQIANFPEGQFVALQGGEVVGYAASVLVTEKDGMSPSHNWNEISGGGYCSTHNPKGEYLYGVEVMVNPNYRGNRIGQRLYSARKRLVEFENYKGIIFAGRMPFLAQRLKKAKTPENYLQMVQNKEIRDHVINFQIRNGFEILGLITNYLEYDVDSLGYAVHMVWRNAGYVDDKERQKQPTLKQSYDLVRVASVQYMQRGISSFEEFVEIVTYFVDVVADYRSDFVLFPELFTLQLLSIENEAVQPDVAINHLTQYTERLTEVFSQLAIKFNVNIIAGSHPTMVEDGKILNIAYVFLRNGEIHEQPKIHPTPNEEYWWNIQGGDKASVIDTDCGPIGVMICYDSEFPELSRHLVDQGAKILFVPFCTDVRQSYLRVRYSCQARAVENQVYVVMAGNVGNLPRVQNMDIQYAQSCILTPCDLSFARDGIAADSTPNVETLVFADLRLEDLSYARQNGAVRNLADRRHDLYQMKWTGK